jgi:hypothetical protein
MTTDFWAIYFSMGIAIFTRGIVTQPQPPAFVPPGQAKRLAEEVGS